MQAYKKIFLAMACAPTCLSVAQADPVVEARTKLQRMYDVQNVAVEHKNITAFMSIYSPRFTGRTLQGKKLNREQVRENMLSLFTHSSSLKGTTSIQHLSMQRDEAHVTTVECSLIIAVNPVTRRRTTLIDKEIDLGIWKRIADTWKEYAVRVLSENKTIVYNK